MRISSMFSRLSGVCLSVLIGCAFVVSQPLVVSGDAQAQGYGHGVVLGGKRTFKQSGFTNRVGISRSGVRYGKFKRGKYHRYHRHLRPNSRLRLRQREIARRNVLVQRENEFRRLYSSTRRSGPNGRFLSRAEREFLLNENYLEPDLVPTTQDGLIRRTGVCPSGHDCGYRIYSDGTGPRIITPGVRLGGGLPGYDGLNGPKVITLD